MTRLGARFLTLMFAAFAIVFGILSIVAILVTIAVLVTGLYLWIARRRRARLPSGRVARSLAQAEPQAVGLSRKSQ